MMNRHDISQYDTAHRAALDSSDLNAVKLAAKRNQPEAIKAAAQQFEALFMNMMLKSMRDAAPQDGPFDSQQSRMYTSMLDQKLSENFSRRGIGLADALTRQLTNNAGLAPVPAKAPAMPDASGSHAQRPQASRAAPATLAGVTMAAASKRSSSGPEHVRVFRDKLAEHAKKASELTGIPANFMLGQAALESGWGRREITLPDGSKTHNLFGVKASKNWSGRVVEVATTEYVNGVPQKRMEKFRAYDSYAAAFEDYARLLTNNPRYQKVLANAQDAIGFAQGLQRAGYATDPRYAEKLTSIIQRRLTA